MEQFDGSTTGVVECSHGSHLQIYRDVDSSGTVIFIGCCTRCGFYSEITGNYIDEVFNNV